MLIISHLEKHARCKEEAKRKEKLRFKIWVTKVVLTSILSKGTNLERDK